MLGEQTLNAGTRYGCMFCKTGRELAVARDLQREWEGVRACAATIVKRRTRRGVKRLQTEVVFDGYVFFGAPDGFLPCARPNDALKILRSSDGDWRLVGYDAWFAEWLLKQDGVIGLSKARKVGDAVQILQGPLKDLEGQIVRVDRRNRSGQVSLSVGGRAINVWLGFEWLEDADLSWAEWQGKAERLLSR